MRDARQELAHSLPHYTCSVTTGTVAARVHNISKERECLTAHICCTNALRQVSPVNYHILTDLINT